jgi:hypothetical protein
VETETRPLSIDRFDAIAQDVLIEVRRATAIHGKFNSTHEGYAVILEELDELWHAVKRNNRQQSIAEAYQVAAMAIRFIADLGG